MRTSDQYDALRARALSAGAGQKSRAAAAAVAQRFRMRRSPSHRDMQLSSLLSGESRGSRE